MAVNLVKYKDELLKGWQEVVDDKNPNDWVLFTYEGQSYDLKVFSKGDGGITEMAEDLNSSKIMYAFCRVKDPKTSLPKNVLINWQGESAPAIRKGTCANHLSAIENFFKGIHVTVNARTEDEVDADYVLDKVAKASGSVYNFKLIETKENDGESGPVGAVYQRVNPSREINAKARDSFWAKEEEEEKKRQAEEHRRKEIERKRREEELKQRELEGSRAREQQVQSRMRIIAEQRQAEEKASGRSIEEIEKIKWAKQREEDEHDDEERRMRSEILRRQRSQEAQALIKQRSIDARAIFEQNSAAGQLTTNSRRSSSSNVSNVSSPSPTPSPANSFHGIGGSASTKLGRPKWPPSTSSSNSVSPTPVSTTPLAVSPTPAPVNNSSPTPSAQNNLSNSSRPQPISPARENHNGYTAESPTPMIVPPAPEFADIPPITEPASVSAKTVADEAPLSPAHALLHQSNHFEEQRATEDEEQDWESPPLEAEPAITVATENVIESDAHGYGIRARALYDYQADDEGEISFDPGDIITHIDQIDPGWWQGMAPDGTYGLFPANYVELIED